MFVTLVLCGICGFREANLLGAKLELSRPISRSRLRLELFDSDDPRERVRFRLEASHGRWRKKTGFGKGAAFCEWPSSQFQVLAPQRKITTTSTNRSFDETR